LRVAVAGTRARFAAPSFAVSRDFAVGLSRQLYGRSIASERVDHRMMETWHPLGVCGVISAFNFPVAVWSWNGLRFRLR
jgi:acyl-CoA reductase-like NAD-dependent aldehyde dehydrogenase